MPRPLRDRHGIEPENAEDRAVLAAMAAMAGRNGMACRTEAGASTGSRLNLAGAFGPTLADRAVARGGRAAVFRGCGAKEEF